MIVPVVDEAGALIAHLSCLDSFSCSSITLNMLKHAMYQTFLHFPKAELQKKEKDLDDGDTFIKPGSSAAVSVARLHAPILIPVPTPPLNSRVL